MPGSACPASGAGGGADKRSAAQTVYFARSVWISALSVLAWPKFRQRPGVCGPAALLPLLPAVVSVNACCPWGGCSSSSWPSLAQDEARSRDGRWLGDRRGALVRGSARRSLCTSAWLAPPACHLSPASGLRSAIGGAVVAGTPSPAASDGWRWVVITGARADGHYDPSFDLRGVQPSWSTPTCLSSPRIASLNPGCRDDHLTKLTTATPSPPSTTAPLPSHPYRESRQFAT